MKRQTGGVPARQHVAAGTRQLGRMVFFWAAMAVIQALPSDQAAAAGTAGIPWTGPEGVRETVSDIMARESQMAINGGQSARVKPLRRLNRRGLPQNPDSPDRPHIAQQALATDERIPLAPQTPGTSFTGATLADTTSFPPDTMGAAGPAQFIVAVNGRIRTFNKNTDHLRQHLAHRPDD